MKDSGTLIKMGGDTYDLLSSATLGPPAKVWSQSLFFVHHIHHDPRKGERFWTIFYLESNASCLEDKYNQNA
jgi:hypothetical protein